MGAPGSDLGRSGAGEQGDAIASGQRTRRPGDVTIAERPLREIGGTAAHLLQADDVAVTGLHPVGESPFQGSSDAVDVEAGDAHGESLSQGDDAVT